MASFVAHGSAVSNPFYPDLGGTEYFLITANFSDTPPVSFNYEVRLVDDKKIDVVPPWTGTRLTNGNKKIEIEIPWDGLINGQPVGNQSYRLESTFTWDDGEETQTVSSAHCKGVEVLAGDRNNAFSIEAKDDVDGVSGTNTMRAVDLYIPALGIPLVVERYANSAAAQSHPGYGGYGEWMFNFQEYLWHDNHDDSRTVVFMDRSQVRFAYSGGPNPSYAPYAPYHQTYSLEPGPDSTFILTFKNHWKHIFNAAGRLIRIENTTGQAITYTWLDNDFPLKRITDASNRHLEFDYAFIDIGHYEMTITDWDNRKYTYLFRFGENKLVRYTDPAGNVTSYADPSVSSRFDGTQSVTLPNGFLFKNEPQGKAPLGTKVGSQTPAGETPGTLGTPMTFDFNRYSGKTSVYDGDRSWHYQYNPQTGLMTSKTDGAGNTWKFEYDETNRTVTRITDPQRNTTEYSYDGYGNILTATDALGRTTSFEYHPTFRGKVTRITYPWPDTPPYLEETFTYDITTGNLVSHTSPGGITTNFTYNASGLLQTSTNALNKTVTYGYDFHGNITSITDPLTHGTGAAYDSQCNMVSITDPLNHASTYTYDTVHKSDNLITETDALGNEVNYEYDGQMNITKIDGDLGRVMEFTYDAFNRPRTEKEPVPLQSETAYEGTYHYNNYLEFDSYTDNLNRTWSFERDTLGRLTKITGPMGYYKTFSYPTYMSQRVITDEDGRTTTLHFDSVGQLSSIRYSDGNEVHYEYDSLGRVTRVKSGNKNDCANLYGSNPGNPRNFKYGSDPNIGCKTYGFKASKVVEYSYNADGQITEIRFKGATPQEDKTIGMTYDTIGRLESVTNIQGYATTYGYDDANRLTSAAYRGKEFTFTYDNADRLTTITYPASTGIVKNISYYNNDLVQQIKFEKGMDNLYQVDYWYDEANRRTRKDVTLPGDPDPITTRFDYVYDTVDQLREVKKNNVTIETFTINPAKNRTTYTNSEDPSKNTTYTYDADDRMLTSTAVNQAPPNTTAYAYDNTGNQTMVTHPDATETTYSWNAAGQLTRIDFPDATSSTYEYDWMGMRDRVQDRFGNDVKSYWWIADFDILPFILTTLKTLPGNQEFANYLYGSNLLMRDINIDDTNPTFTYFLLGDNENVVALADNMGNVTDRYEYTIFGELLSLSGSDVNRFLFSAEVNDEDSNLVYLRARYLDKIIGRFVSKDKVHRINDNRFLYCSNNPIGYLDSLGLRDTIADDYRKRIPFSTYNDYRNNVPLNCAIQESLTRCSMTFIGVGIFYDLLIYPSHVVKHAGVPRSEIDYVFRRLLELKKDGKITNCQLKLAKDIMFYVSDTYPNYVDIRCGYAAQNLVDALIIRFPNNQDVTFTLIDYQTNVTCNINAVAVRMNGMPGRIELYVGSDRYRTDRAVIDYIQDK